MAKKRTNIIPIIEDARHPQRYRMLVGMVDVVFADVAQPDQARIVALNSQYFLKAGGKVKEGGGAGRGGASELLRLGRCFFTFLNRLLFLPAPCHRQFVISIKANCIDSTSPAEAVFAREVRSQIRCIRPSES